MPNSKHIDRILQKKSENVTLICNSKFAADAKRLKRKYPSIHLIMRWDIHAKMVLIEPDIVWLSSANFGCSEWFEESIGIHSELAYKFYIKQLMDHLGVEHALLSRLHDQLSGSAGRDFAGSLDSGLSIPVSGVSLAQFAETGRERPRTDFAVFD